MTKGTSNSDLQSNYDFIQNLPLVRKLNTKIKKLKRTNSILNRVILHLGGNLDKPNVIDLTGDDIVIKEEPDDERITYKLEESCDIEANSFECECCTKTVVVRDDDEENEYMIANCDGCNAMSCRDCLTTDKEGKCKSCVEEEEVEASEEEEEEEEVEASEEEEVEASEEEEVEASEEEEEEEVEASEEEEEEEEVEASEEEEEEEEVEVEDDEEVFEVTIKGNTYYTNNAQNGEIYAIDSEGDPGDQVGSFRKGKAVFI